MTPKFDPNLDILESEIADFFDHESQRPVDCRRLSFQVRCRIRNNARRRRMLYTSGCAMMLILMAPAVLEEAVPNDRQYSVINASGERERHIHKVPDIPGGVVGTPRSVPLESLKPVNPKNSITTRHGAKSNRSSQEETPPPARNNPAALPSGKGGKSSNPFTPTPRPPTYSDDPVFANSGDGMFMQERDNSQVYIVLDEQPCLIPDVDTMLNLFYNQEITFVDEIKEVSKGPALSSGAELAQDPKVGRVYLISNNTKRWIVDPETFNKYHFNWNKINSMSKDDLDAIPTGNDIY